MTSGGPGGPFNPFRGSMLKGGGRGSLRVHASSTASARGHILQKRTLTAQQRPSTPALTPLSASAVTFPLQPRNHDPSLSEFGPTRTGFLTSGSITPAFKASLQPDTQREPRSSRSSFDIQREGAPLPDEPQTPTQDYEDSFLDTYSSSLSQSSTRSESSSSSSSSRLDRSSSRFDRSSSDASLSSSHGQSVEEAVPAHAILTSETSDAVVEHIHSTAESGSKVHLDNPTLQPFSCSDTACSSTAHSDDSACSATSAATTIDGHSPFGSYPDNVVVSLLCPHALAGHLIGRDGQTASTLQVPGTRWWLTDKAWKLGGAANLRVITIQGPTSHITTVVAKLMAHLTSESAPANSKYFKTRQGLVKAKVLLQSWLVGSVLGKGGSTIKHICSQSGAQLQVSSVQTAVDSRRQLNVPAAIDGEAALQIAGPTISAVASCIQLVFEAVRKNPCYKPVVFKNIADFKLASV